MSYFSLHESTESKTDNNLKSRTQTFPWLSGCKVPAFQSQLNDRIWVRDQPTCPTAGIFIKRRASNWVKMIRNAKIIKKYQNVVIPTQ